MSSVSSLVRAKSSRNLEFPDIPTGISRNESRILAHLAKDKVVLEIGSLLGYSTVCMAKVAKEVWAVDPHSGYPDVNPKPTSAIFFQNLEKHGVINKVRPFITTALEFFARSSEMLEFVPEFIFLDLNGHYTTTSTALHRIVEDGWLDEPNTRLAVHDYGHPDWPGVKTAVDEHVDKDACLELTHLIDTMAILQNNYN